MKNKPNLYISIVFLICFQVVPAHGQYVNDRETRDLPFDYLQTNNPDLDLQDILSSKHTFISSKNWKPENPRITYWLRLDFADYVDHLEDRRGYRLRTSMFSWAYLLLEKEDTIQKKPFGKFNREKHGNSLSYAPGVPFKKENLFQGRYLYVKLQMFSPFKGTTYFSYLTDEADRFYTAYYDKNDLDRIIVDQIYLGVCLILIIIFLVIYLNIRKPELLFYALYVFCSAVYLLQENINIPGYRFFFDSLGGYWFVTVCQILINLFYLIFSIHYLETERDYPKLHKALRTMAGVLILIILLDMMVYFSKLYAIHEGILDLQRLIMTIFGLVSMVYLLKNAKNKLAIIIVVGSFFYMAGALFYLFIDFKYYMIIGTSLEIVIFSLGLAYKIKREHTTRLKLERQLSLKEIGALRARMNPHFIYNALNSIQHLILKNDVRSALKYLSNFGKLARNVLESSYNSTVSLSYEIQLLNSYLELESFRFDGSFSYSLQVDDELDIDCIEIPLMLIHPFVENAITHGLINKKNGDKNLSVRFKNQEDFTVCEVEDNGIGRKASTRTRSILKGNDKQRGIEIAVKRLELHYDRSIDKKNVVKIIDKYDSEGNSAGTKVTIKLSKTLKETT